MIALDPKQTWDVGFAHEAALPLEQRNVLVCRFATDAQYTRIGELVEEGNRETTTPARRRAALGEALGILGQYWRGPLVAPEGGQKAYDAATIFTFLSLDDAWELVMVIRTDMRLAETERKKSLLPSGSAATATSAGSAGGEPVAGVAAGA